MLCLWGCAAPGGGGVEAPLEGTVVFHSPPTSRTSPFSARRQYSATTIIFTTAGGGLEDDPTQNLEVSVGTRPDDGGAGAIRSGTRIAAGTKAATTRVLDRERFRQLWRTLDEAGLFRLPRYRGSRPPESENYILVKTPQNTWIYTRPRPGSNSQKDLEETARLLPYWQASFLAIVDYTNS